MNLFASEWIKIRSVRGTWIIAAATVIVTTLVGLVGISGELSEWKAALPADFDPTANSLKGILVGQILIATLGAQPITGEYATGQIVATLAIAPRRGVLLATKSAVVLLIALATAVIAVATSFGVGQAVLAAADLPTAAVTDPATVRALGYAVAYLALAALLGLAFGAITRSASGALAIIVAVGLLAPALAPGLPGGIGEFAETYWPPTAGQASYTTTGDLAPLAGIALMAIATGCVMFAAQLTFRTRDA